MRFPVDGMFFLSDPLNPMFGFTVVVRNARTGEVLFSRHTDPDTCEVLRTAHDCLRVLNNLIEAIDD